MKKKSTFLICFIILISYTNLMGNSVYKRCENISQANKFISSDSSFWWSVNNKIFLGLNTKRKIESLFGNVVYNNLKKHRQRDLYLITKDEKEFLHITVEYIGNEISFKVFEIGYVNELALPKNERIKYNCLNFFIEKKINLGLLYSSFSKMTKNILFKKQIIEDSGIAVDVYRYTLKKNIGDPTQSIYDSEFMFKKGKLVRVIFGLDNIPN